jgi:hypothetical protein
MPFWHDALDMYKNKVWGEIGKTLNKKRQLAHYFLI